MRKLLFNILRASVSIGLLIWLLARTDLNVLGEILTDSDLRLLMLGLGLYQVGLVMRAWRWQLLLRDAGLFMSLPKLVGLNYVGAFFANLLPVSVGGDIVRAVELRDDQSGAVSGGIVLLEKVLGVSSLMAISLLSLLFGWPLLAPSIRLPLLGLSIAVLLGIGLLIEGRLMRSIIEKLLPERFALVNESWFSKFYNALSGCSRRVLLIAWGISLANNFLGVTFQYMIGRAVGIQVGFHIFAMFAPIVTLASLLPSVRGLGIREQGYRLLLTSINISGDLAVATGLAIFAVHFTTSVFGALYYAGRNLHGLLTTTTDDMPPGDTPQTQESPENTPLSY